MEKTTNGICLEMMEALPDLEESRVREMYRAFKNEKPAPIYAYRTLELDEDGDPYDFGVVRAHTRREAAKFVSERLQEVAPGAASFKLYPLLDVEEDGVLGSDTKEFITKHWASNGREC